VFLVFSAAVVTALIVGVVSISAMAVQTSFAVEAVERRIAGLADRAELLTNDVAALSAPGRIARWARDRGMMPPTEVEVLTVRGGGTG
jgi:cell division protein FtsL